MKIDEKKEKTKFFREKFEISTHFLILKNLKLYSIFLIIKLRIFVKNKEICINGYME